MAVLTFKVVGTTIVLLLLFAYGALFPNQPPSISTPEGETKGGIDVPAIATSRFGTPYPTYQFASWAGGGISITSSASTNDLKWQQQYIPAASAIFPWGGISYSNWCAHANTTTTRISGSGEVYSSGTANSILKYQIPYLIFAPADGYGFQCIGWAKDVTVYHPDLITYDSSGVAVNYNTHDLVRVDDMNFATQTYRDLVNLKNNLNSANPQLLNYWYGINICSGGIWCDGGTYFVGPSTLGMWGNQSIYLFATSGLCVGSGSNSTYRSCSYLASASKGTATSSGGHACCKTSVIYALVSSLHMHDYTTYVNGEYLLGLSYAAYNFTQKYNFGHSFIILPAKPSDGADGGFSIGTSNYPYPYNTTYIKGLDLLNKFISKPSYYYENGNRPTVDRVYLDTGTCGTSVGSNAGQWLGSTSGPNIPFYVRNNMWFQGFCKGNIIQFGNLDYSPGTAYYNTLVAFGTILNRMKNVGNVPYPSVSITASYHGDPTRGIGATGLTLLGSSGKPLLAWFYTNSTSWDTASVALNGPAYGIGNNWIAISALDWSVVGSGTGSTIPLTVRIPARGWSPIYVMTTPSSNLESIYTNVVLTSSFIGSTSATYNLDGPHTFSSWLVVKSNTSPLSVTSNRAGTLQQYSTLSALNQTFVGMRWAGSVWQNLTQTGWYYDSGNQLLYIHFPSGSPVSITVQQVAPVTSTTFASTSSTTPTTSITSISSSTLSTTTRSSSTSTLTVTLPPNTPTIMVLIIFLGGCAALILHRGRSKKARESRTSLSNSGRGYA